MGAQGIKRRKKRHDLPDVGRITEGDVNRLFGRFTWNQYSPAGNLERFGFFTRQLRRNGTRGVGSFIAQARWMFVLVPACIIALAVVLHFSPWS